MSDSSIRVSFVGLAFVAMLLVPNLLWARRKPEGYDDAGENRLLLALERFGQVATTVCLLFQRSADAAPVGWGLAWFVAAAALMIAYEMYWVRYFRGAHTLKDFYGRFLGVPVPGASLPIVAALCLSAYRGDIWLALSAALLGIGHIGIHVAHARKARCL